MVDKKNAYRHLMVNAEEETPLRRFKCWLVVYITRVGNLIVATIYLQLIQN